MTHFIAVGALVGPLGVLMCRRLPSSRWYPGKWDFPGGHIEDGETAGEALARELLEEVNVRITAPKELPAFTVRANDGATDGLALTGWVLTEWSGVPANLATNEHDEIRWFTPSDAGKLDLAHAVYADVLRHL
ncbi:NUDIX domain-containing protein [uncultured Arthrobacter sp.]|uniref:NUDIX domain-containing protein n=1 Tax=uncultured Arthrobacter sp. TaxID=114050 RepID=UPI0032177996